MDPKPSPLKKHTNSFYNTIYGLIIINRPVDGLIIGGSVILGMIIGLHALPSLDKVILGFLGGIFLLGGMDTFNDLRDLEIDKISKPWRPLPQGLVNPKVALIAAILETFLAVLIGIYAGFDIVLVCFFVIVMAIAYSIWLKPFFLTKNLVVALSLTMASFIGYIATNPDSLLDLNFLLFLILTFVSAFNFEIHKDLGDYNGDLKFNVKTLPTQLGINRTIYVLTVGYLISWLLAFSFTFSLGFDLIFLGILAFTGVFIIYILYLLLKDPIESIEITRRITTAVMGAILLGLGLLFIKF